MDLVAVLHFVNLFFAGILAGIEVAIHYGISGPAEILSEQSQIRLRQALILRLRVLVPAFFVPTTLSGIAVAVLDGVAPGVWFRCAGVLAMLIWIGIRSSVPSPSTVPRSPGRQERHRRIGKRKSTTRSVSMLLVSGRRSWHLHCSRRRWHSNWRLIELKDG
jgi:hypothetical protein